MLPPLPRRSVWAYCFAHSPSRISLPRKGCRVGLRIVRFEDCSAFTHDAACTLARSPIRDPLSGGFRHFVTSMPAPVASGWSGCRVGLAPTGKAPPCHGAHPDQTRYVRKSLTKSEYGRRFLSRSQSPTFSVGAKQKKSAGVRGSRRDVYFGPSS